MTSAQIENVIEPRKISRGAYGPWAITSDEHGAETRYPSPGKALRPLESKVCCAWKGTAMACADGGDVDIEIPLMLWSSRTSQSQWSVAKQAPAGNQKGRPNLTLIRYEEGQRLFESPPSQPRLILHDAGAGKMSMDKMQSCPREVQSAEGGPA